MSEMKIAVSSMTNAVSFLEEGTTTAMRKLKECGVDYVEMSQHIQFDERTIPEFIKAGQETGIQVCALSTGYSGTIPTLMPPLCHNGQTLKVYSANEDFGLLVELCQEFRCQYVRFAGFPGAQMKTGDDVRTYMAGVEGMASRFAEVGIGFCAHNHADEFMRVGGKWVMEWALELAPHLQFEIDVLNAMKCGINPVDLFDWCKGRAPLVHLQDLQVCAPDSGEWMKEEYRGVPVGEGNLNLSAIWQAAAQAGSKYVIIEQAKFYGRDPYECIKNSVNVLKTYL